MRLTELCLVSWMSVNSLFAAASLAGIPDQIFPELLRDWSVTYSNDSTLYDRDQRYRKHDDYRTATLSGHYTFSPDWLLAADLSLLTDKDMNRRSDVFTISLGRRHILYQQPQQNADLHYGAGIRISDDLGGQSIQNNLHTFTSGIDVKMPYEDDAHSGFVYVRNHYLHTFQSRWYYDVRSACTADTHGLLQIDLQLRNGIMLPYNSGLHAGLRWRDFTGDALHRTHERVLEQEQHWWFIAGAHWQRLGFQFEHHPHDSRSQFMISLSHSVNQ